MEKFWSTIHKISSSYSILTALGLGMSGSTIIGIWAAAANNGYVIGVLVGIFVFTCTLLCWAIMLWMRDRVTRLNPNMQKTLLDCSWGLRIDRVILHKDKNAEQEWQLTIDLRNAMPFPLRVEVIEHRLVIENRVPDNIISTKNMPHVLGAGETFSRLFPSYKRGSLPGLHGEIDMTVVYGHPDGAYSRKSTRKLTFLAKVPSQFNQIRGFSIPVAFGPREEDKDEPYLMQSLR